MGPFARSWLIGSYVLLGARLEPIRKDICRSAPTGSPIDDGMPIVFAIIAAVTVAAAVAAMSLRNLVHCALALAVAFAGIRRDVFAAWARSSSGLRNCWFMSAPWRS